MPFSEKRGLFRGSGRFFRTFPYSFPVEFYVAKAASRAQFSKIKIKKIFFKMIDLSKLTMVIDKSLTKFSNVR